MLTFLFHVPKIVGLTTGLKFSVWKGGIAMIDDLIVGLATSFVGSVLWAYVHESRRDLR